MWLGAYECSSCDDRVRGRNAWRSLSSARSRLLRKCRAVSRSTAPTGFARRRRCRCAQTGTREYTTRTVVANRTWSPPTAVTASCRHNIRALSASPTAVSPTDNGLVCPVAGPMERVATEVATKTAAMLVATVVSMWALSAMAVTVRHGRSRMARWAQQQHGDLQPQPPPPPSPPPPSTSQTPRSRSTAAVMATMVAADDRFHDPGGGLSRAPLSTLHVTDDGQRQHHRDKANVLLRIVESQQQLGGNCTAGTDLNMGEGVVDRYAQVCSLVQILGFPFRKFS